MFNIFNSKETVSISPSIVVFTIFFLLGLYFLYFIKSIIILLFLGFIVMVALNPAVTMLNRRLRIPRAIGSVLTYLLVIGSLVTIAALIIPSLTNQVYQLLKSIDVPVLQQELLNYGFDRPELGNIVNQVGNSVSVAFAIITSTFSSIFTFFTLLVISLYMMLDRPNLHKKIMWFTREEKQVEAFKQFLDSLEFQLGGWVRGQLVLMVVIGVVTFIGLSLLGVPFALPLAILAGMLEIVPNLGPTLAALPAIALAYIYLGPVMAGATAIFYVIVQQFENNIIVPKIMKDNVDVNPLVAIVTILIGLELGGIIGAILAIPMYIVLRTLYSLWFRQALPRTSSDKPAV